MAAVMDLVRIRRRSALAAGVLALAMPVLSSADGPHSDDEPWDRDRVRIEAAGLAGHTRYTSCNKSYDVHYGGLGGEMRMGMQHGPSLRAGAGYAWGHQVGWSSGSPESSDEMLASAAGFVQGGEDWEWFGFLAGIGGGRRTSNGWYPLFPVTLRLGPIEPLFVELHFLDTAPIERGLWGGDVVLASQDVGRLALGMRWLVDADAPVMRLAGDLAFQGGLHLTGAVSGGEMLDEWTWQFELGLAFELDPSAPRAGG